MKKISIEKSEEVSSIVEKVIDAESAEIILIVPRFSHLAESLSNFHLLKREADVLGRKITIESVDNRVIEMAEMSGLEASNPFLAKGKNSRQFVDIVPAKKSFTPKKEVKAQEKIRVHEKRTEDFDDYALEEIPDIKIIRERKNIFGKLFSGLVSSYKLIIWLMVLAAIGAGAFWYLPKAEVKITAKKWEWTYNDSVSTDKSSKIDFIKMIIPNQVFSQTKNFDMKFPATGKKQVEDKAKGVITVYNSYSSSPQPLIHDTRFMSPDGKVFYTIKSVTIPGAKITEGKIIPSSIDVQVVAEKAGDSYNIGPTKLFTIPGFKGTPKYQAFYGESKAAMSGGFVGELTYPTADDIKTAKTSVSNTLESNLKTAVYMQIPQEFKILEDSTSFSVVSQTIKEQADAENNFSIFSEGKVTVIAFKEEDLKQALVQRALSEKGADLEVKNMDLSYGLVRADFQNGKMSFPVNFRVMLSSKIDAAALRDKIAGQPEIELRKTILSLPDIEKATVSLWPFWVRSAPSNLNKVKIIID